MHSIGMTHVSILSIPTLVPISCVHRPWQYYLVLGLRPKYPTLRNHPVRTSVGGATDPSFRLALILLAIEIRQFKHQRLTFGAPASLRLLATC